MRFLIQHIRTDTHTHSSSRAVACRSQQINTISLEANVGLACPDLIQAVSWKATAWFPGKKVHGITKLKQATVTLDFGSRKWEGEMQFLGAGATKAVYALQDTNWVLKVTPRRQGIDLLKTLTETELARSDGKASKLVPHYFGGLFWTGGHGRSSLRKHTLSCRVNVTK